MSIPIKCADCAWFQRSDLNPAAGMGRCMHTARHGYWHAEAPHRCKDHEPTGDDDAATEA